MTRRALFLEEKPLRFFTENRFVLALRSEKAARLLSSLCFAAVLLFAQCCFAATTTPSGVDPDMALFAEKMSLAYSYVGKILFLAAALYYISSAIRYFVEDSDDAARKHLLGASLAVFMAASSIPLVRFILSGVFAGQITVSGQSITIASLTDGKEAVKLTFQVLRYLITMTLNLGLFLAGVYWIVSALKYVFQEDSTSSRSHLIRVGIGLFILATARAFIAVAVTWWAG